jgi:hypothetical protein
MRGRLHSSALVRALHAAPLQLSACLGTRQSLAQVRRDEGAQRAGGSVAHSLAVPPPRATLASGGEETLSALPKLVRKVGVRSLRRLLLLGWQRLLEVVLRLRARRRHRRGLRSLCGRLLRLAARCTHEALHCAADAAALWSTTAEHAANSLRATTDSGAHARDETCDAARRLEHASEHLTPTRFLCDALLVGLLVQRLEALLKRVVRVDGVLRLRLEALTPRLTLRSEGVCTLPDETSDVALRLRLRHLPLTAGVLQDVARIDALAACEARQCADWLRTKTESHGSPFC